MLARCLAILSLLLVGACAVSPVPSRQCHFAIVPLEVELPAFRAPPLEQIVRQTYASGASPDFLLMSGGSEHGSFGAGVLSAWGDKHGRLPDFELVTGVSTGAILASPAFAGDHEYSAARYSDVWEKDLLKPYAKSKDVGLWNLPSVLRHGAVASLDPMRDLLADYLVGKGGFEKIAAKVDQGKLLVGAVDVDSGKMVAFDMTDMAARIVAARKSGDKAGADYWAECYYDAIQASASAPLAATPVFIDNRMYADGGMRYSLFGERMMEVLALLKEEQPSLPPPNIYMIVNGTQETEVWCPRSSKDRRDCKTLSDPEAAMSEQPPEWSLIGLGMRSVDILQNQVSRFSVHSLDVENKALFGQNAANLRFLRIGTDAPNHAFGGKRCKDWHDEDERRDHPLQFHHFYMGCIVDYGKFRAKNDPRW